ncbi:uncharacterized protein LOC144750166 [Ciona intestinalis]
MPHCVAVDCTNQYKGKKNADVSYHSFPKNKKIRKAWEIAVSRKNLPSDPYLCSDHFTQDCFDESSLLKHTLMPNKYRIKRTLKKNSIPTIFPHKKGKEKLQQTGRPCSKKREDKKERRRVVKELLEVDQQLSTADFESLDADNVVMDISDGQIESNVLMSETSSTSIKRFKDAETQTDKMITVCTPLQKVDAYCQFPVQLSEPVIHDHSYNSFSEPSSSSAFEISRNLNVDDATNDNDVESVESTDTEHNFMESDSSSCVTEQADSNCAHDYRILTEPEEETNRTFIIYESQLKQLLRFCPDCGSPIDPELTVETQRTGAMLTLQLACLNGCDVTWHSHPTSQNKRSLGNIFLISALYFSGMTFSKFVVFAKLLNLKLFHESTYYALRKSFVFPVVERAWNQEKSRMIECLKSENQPVMLAGDGRCDSPGHNAKYGTYTFLDVKTSKVVDFKGYCCD